MIIKTIAPAEQHLCSKVLNKYIQSAVGAESNRRIISHLRRLTDLRHLFYKDKAPLGLNAFYKINATLTQRFAQPTSNRSISLVR